MRLLLFAVLVVSSCSLPTPYTAAPVPERVEYIRSHMEGRPLNIVVAYRKGHIVPGMTAAEVRSLTSKRYIEFWYVDRTTFSNGKYYEIWTPYKPWVADDGWSACRLVLDQDVVDEVVECTRPA